MQAIPTEYNGYSFRSRLEARWAVFFDLVDWQYVYEPEGYMSQGEKYLPDFFLPTMEGRNRANGKILYGRCAFPGHHAFG